MSLLAELERVGGLIAAMDGDVRDYQAATGTPVQDAFAYSARVSEAATARACINLLRSHGTALREALADAERLRLIADEYLHVVPFDMPTGGGDADVGWEVRQSQGNRDAVLYRHYADNLRAAIDGALRLGAEGVG